MCLHDPGFDASRNTPGGNARHVPITIKHTAVPPRKRTTIQCSAIYNCPFRTSLHASQDPLPVPQKQNTQTASKPPPRAATAKLYILPLGAPSSCSAPTWAPLPAARTGVAVRP